jgi:glycosyltransferase involved in cell wall biosynthesis
MDELQTQRRPLVTIVVPVRNGAGTIRESLDSILAQTYEPIEVIVMDDASDDETPAILAGYAEAGVQVVRQAECRGIYANANDGIALARGELVGVFHGDDLYFPPMVERQVAYLERHPEVGAVFAADVFVDAGGRELGRLALPPEVRGSRPLDYAAVVNALLTHKNAFLRCPSALVRASVYRSLGVYDQERYRNTADLEMWLRIARAHRIAVIDEHLYAYRRGHGSSSERYHSLRVDEERLFAILDEALERDARPLATAAALRAYQGHRAADALVRATSYYILDRREEGVRLLGTVSARRLLRARGVPRPRLLAMLVALHVVLRLPRVSHIARLFTRRWHPAAAAAALETAA